MRNRRTIALGGVLITCTLVAFFALLLPVEWREGTARAQVGDDLQFPPEPPENLKELLKKPLDEDGFEDQNSEEGNRHFFDDFSWRAFVALNWPAREKGRGLPDDDKTFGDTSAERTVWETWKSAPEIVPPDGKPTSWDDFKLQLRFTRALGPNAGRVRIFTKIDKFQDLFQAGVAALGQRREGPLIDQLGHYVRFELRVNKIEYNEIFNKRYYEKDALANAAAGSPGGKVEFPAGSIEVKAAWRELPNDPQILDHFYWRDAVVVDWDTNGKEVLIPTKVGLVGLHIVTKTKQRPNWIWSTFEHEDNVVSTAGGIKPPSFNSKPEGAPWVDPGPSPPADWEKKVIIGKPLPKLGQVEVSRKLDLAMFPATEKINARYRAHPQVKQSVWSHYKLIRTQWPILNTGKPAPSKDVANVTMETYRQKITCMACHDTAAKCRFVYFLELHVDPESQKTLLQRFSKLAESP
jgi:hypothetical protein